MERAVRVVDQVALAQRIERVLAPGMELPGVGERVEDSGHLRFDGRAPDPVELDVQEFNVERRVVDDELGAAHVVQELDGDLAEPRLVGEKLAGDPVDAKRPLLHLALGVDVAVEVVARQPAVQDLDAPDLDDAVAHAGVEPGRLGVQDDLSHARRQCSGAG